MNPTQNLEPLRKEIDEIDVEIQELICKRGAVGKKIADTKRQLSSNPQYFVPEREAKILQDVKVRNTGPISDENMVHIFREIMSATRAVEQLTKVAILGPAGTFTQQATIKHFGHAIESIFQPTIVDIFNAVETSRAEFGVVPVENSTEGVVTYTLDCLADSTKQICGEVNLKIHHTIVSKAEKLTDIKSVLAHTQSILQCRKWISKNLPGVKIETVNSNAEAVVKAKKDSTLAAIASKTAGEMYEMNVLRTNIEDNAGNTTRFLIIGNIKTEPTGKDKTSILLSQQDKPGALMQLLEPFAKNNVSLTKIESRPSKKAMWDYVFFIDFEGHTQDSKISAMLDEVKSRSTLFRILGSYPQAEL